MSWFLITFRCSFSSGIFFLPTRPTCSNIDHSNMNEVRREKVHMRVDTIECAPLLTCLGKAHFFGDYFIEILVNRERRYVTCRCCHRTNRRSWHEHTWSYFFFLFLLLFSLLNETQKISGWLSLNTRYYRAVVVRRLITEFHCVVTCLPQQQLLRLAESEFFLFGVSSLSKFN